MDKEEAKKKLSDLHQILKISEKKQELLSLREQVKKIDLWQNQQNAIEVTSKLSELENEINEFETLDLIINDESSNDDDFKEAAKIIKNLEQKAILSDEHDASGAILSIHAGTGGVDAMDFAMLLERMYLRFIESDKNQADTNLRINTNITNDANLDKSQRDTSLFGIDRSKWQVTVVDRRMGDEAGIKSVTMIISGQYVYGLLKKEAGVHRLVRLSPFNAKNLRQTSFALVEVLPFIGRDDPTGHLEILEKDLKIDTFRASGAGGQHVNVTDSAVRITHLPTGIVVSVQNERSQHQNREVAMNILRSKLQILLEIEKKEQINELRGDLKQAVWGNQIRSYVMQPYTLVKDHRTEYECSNVEDVLDGQIEDFIEEELIISN
ncbi:MAG: Peptide chain release factor 2 [Berkelbacteria bacterium GW2011_GWA2_38_9]|uniref:Peptide chain release factor 2 n=1 Tax=Berkelbacteria bacterium GW2011_GWA2_38_9 TaxID=1618334 RepID=A0A0G0NPT6_9BACT|nr:MAG: Peptide chain release factor 2 [Berkelbacteria bacterium GW2011_GWA2_38_9]